MKAFLLTVFVLVVLILHHDLWNWTNKSLVLGFLPIGLAYHIGYAFLASFTMAVLVRYAWPHDLERETLDLVAHHTDEDPRG